MIAIVSLLSLLACVQAFTSNSLSRKASSKVALSAEKSKSVPFLPVPPNLSGLVGDKQFDPIGFSNIIDVKFLREAELKHGRTAMLGALGFIFSDFAKLPGDIHNVGPVAAHNAAVNSGAMAQILALVVALEFISVVAVKDMLNGSGRAPGDYGFDPLNFSNGKSDSVKKDLQLKELENGRLAMIAFGGMVTQAVALDKSFPYF